MPSAELDPSDNVLALRGAIRQLVDWFDQQQAGHQPEIAALESALRNLRALGDQPGQVGIDIRLVLAGGHPTSPAATVAAINRLRAELQSEVA